MRVPGKNKLSGQQEGTSPVKRKKVKAGSFALKVGIVSAILTICLYYACTIRPEKFWMAGFSGFLIPAAICSQMLMLAYLLWKKPLAALIPGLALFLGLRFFQASFAWHYLITEKCHEFKVLSLNARAFGVMQQKNESRKEDVNLSVANLIASEADVICIQEMYDFPGIKPFNVARTLKKAGYKHVFYSIARKHWGSSVGMAIFSRHPIIDRKVVLKKEGSTKGVKYILTTGGQ
jgi:hypothetical protein